MDPADQKLSEKLSNDQDFKQDETHKSNQAVTFSILPTDLICAIVAYFPFLHLIRLYVICKLWNGALHNVACWKHLSMDLSVIFRALSGHKFDHNNDTDYALLNAWLPDLVARYPLVRYVLSWSSPLWNPEVLLEICEKAVELRSVKGALHSWQAQQDGIDLVVRLSQSRSAAELKSLHLIKLPLSCAALRDVGPAFQNLRHLRFAVSNDVAEALVHVDGTRAFPALHWLSLDLCNRLTDTIIPLYWYAQIANAFPLLKILDCSCDQQMNIAKLQVLRSMVCVCLWMELPDEFDKPLLEMMHNFMHEPCDMKGQVDKKDNNINTNTMNRTINRSIRLCHRNLYKPDCPTSRSCVCVNSLKSLQWLGQYIPDLILDLQLDANSPDRDQMNGIASWTIIPRFTRLQRFQASCFDIPQQSIDLLQQLSRTLVAMTFFMCSNMTNESIVHISKLEDVAIHIEGIDILKATTTDDSTMAAEKECFNDPFVFHEYKELGNITHLKLELDQAWLVPCQTCNRAHRVGAHGWYYGGLLNCPQLLQLEITRNTLDNPVDFYISSSVIRKILASCPKLRLFTIDNVDTSTGFCMDLDGVAVLLNTADLETNLIEIANISNRFDKFLEFN